MYKKIIIILSAILFFGIYENSNATTTQQMPKTAPAATNVIQTSDYTTVSPISLVETPSKYMNTKVKMKAKFDKFSTIGLDYAPVNRDAKKHISFLIKRENVTGYNIPLSELKLILKRDYAEKELVNIETGDDIEIYGKVFSTALGDPWVDIEKVTILTPKAKKEVTDKK